MIALLIMQNPSPAAALVVEGCWLHQACKTKLRLVLLHVWRLRSAGRMLCQLSPL
jgi:hypothetical protein